MGLEMNLLVILIALLAICGATRIATVWAHEWQKTRMTEILKDLKELKYSLRA